MNSESHIDSMWNTLDLYFIMSCLQRRSATAQLDPPMSPCTGLQRRSATAQLDPPMSPCRLCSVSPLEMSAVRRNVANIACGRAPHTGFALPLVPQMFRCRGGSLSRAHSVGRPPCTPRQCVTTRESFCWVDVLSVASHCSCHLATRASVVFHRRGWDAAMKLLAYVGGYSRAGGYGGCVAGL